MPTTVKIKSIDWLARITIAMSVKVIAIINSPQTL